MIIRWQALLLWTISAELAHTLNIPIRSLQLQFTILLALVVALTLKVAGVLLAPALLIIPAACMATLASSPGIMVLGAT
ncbi:metal ABC transporter permease, partial [Acinetobacter baumannii]